VRFIARLRQLARYPEWIRGLFIFEVRHLGGREGQVNSLQGGLLQHFRITGDEYVSIPAKTLLQNEIMHHLRSSGREGATPECICRACWQGKRAQRKGRMLEMTETTKPGLIKALPLMAIVLVAVIGAFTLRDYLTFETLRENREALLAYRDSHFLLTAVCFIAIYTLIVTFSLPGAAIASMTGGFLFSIFPGTLFNVMAATLGATMIFLAARWGLGDKLAAKMENSQGAVKKIKDGIDENQWSMLFLIRLVPAVPFFVANLVPAMVGVPLYRFVVSTFLGIIPGALVYTSIGAGLGEVFARGETPNPGIIFEPRILLPILGLCALAALPMVLKYISKSKGT